MYIYIICIVAQLFWQQNITLDRKLFITQSKHVIF